jgi:quinolinate synthase
MNTPDSSAVIDVEYEQPACPTQHAWARVPVEPGPKQRAALKERIRQLLKERNAVMVSHYYVHPDLQDLATPPPRWWSRACASWARPPRS